MRNKDIAERFGAGYKDGGTRHLFIEDDTIYSYGHHFPIAKHLGGHVAALTTKKYSQTTSCHVTLVRQALQQEGYVIINTDDVKSYRSAPPSPEPLEELDLEPLTMEEPANLCPVCGETFPDEKPGRVCVNCEYVGESEV